MRSRLHERILFVLIAALLVPSEGLSRPRRGKRDRSKVAQVDAPSPPAPSIERLPAALRVECSDGMPAPLCDAVREAAVEAAGRTYRLVEPVRSEALFVREPALRACRLEECRVAITDQLQVPRLIDVHIHAGGRSGMLGSVSIYDALAKGISGDTDAPLGRRDEKHLRKVIGDAVEYVIGAQRLTATLHLDVHPEGATVKIDDKDRGAIREVKLFLGPHRIRVEKVGYVAVERTVNVTPAGTREQVKLQPDPIRVLIEVLPPGTRVLVDGDPVDARTNVVELIEGKHRVQALGPPDSGYDSLEFEIDVRVGMQPIRKVLPRLAQLRIRAPRGYLVRVDNQMMAPGREEGLTQDLTVTASPGSHSISAESWRGRLLKVSALLVPGTAADIHLQPPSLIPGLAIAGAGVAGIIGGAIMLGLHGQCSSEDLAPMETPPKCQRIHDFSWQNDAAELQPPAAAYLTLSLGAAALIGGAAWFAVNAMNHPLFHRNRAPAKVARPMLVPVVTVTGGALVVQGGF